MADFLASRSETAFEWGKFDCMIFASDAIELLTGADPAKEFRGAYSTEADAIEILKRRGGVRGIAMRGAKKYGFKQIPPLFAQRGDICLGRPEGQDTLGVCQGRYFVFAKSPVGLVYISLDDPNIVNVWRIE